MDKYFKNVISVCSIIVTFTLVYYILYYIPQTKKEAYLRELSEKIENCRVEAKEKWQSALDGALLLDDFELREDVSRSLQDRIEMDRAKCDQLTIVQN